MPSLLPRLLLVASLVAAVVLMPQSHAQPPAKTPLDPDHAAKMVRGTELFKTTVRALFQAKCVKCHSGERVEGEFDMGTRDGLLKGGPGGPAVAPGDHKKSLLYQLVTHQREPHMPHERAKLADGDIARIAEWIDLGAPYDKPFVGKDDAAAWTRKVVPAEAKKHWAFQPLARVAVPAGFHPVDHFVDAKLAAAGLKPNPPADKRTLLRRTYLDLIGLPPTPEQVEAFVKDEAADAFAKVVHALLDSPRHGERWARHWLDLARFAESHGFEHDYDRPTAYHYRDFVIKALNADLPFDTFAKWQLAGDELAPNDPLALTATGYLAAGVHSTQITQNEAEKHRYDELDDMLANVGTTFLGLSVGCARCHDHKFDPVPARDYYRMLAAFTTTVRTEVEVDFEPEKYRAAKASFDAAHAPLTAAVKKYEAAELPAEFAAWEAGAGDKPLSFPWVLSEVAAVTSAGGATLTKQADGGILVTGKNPDKETLAVTLTTTATGLRSLRVEALAHPALVKGGPGRAANGNFALSDLKVTAQPSDKSKPPAPVKLTAARATFEQKGLPVAAAIDADATSAWAVDPQFGKDHAAAFAFAEPVGFPDGTTLVVTLSFHNNTGHGMGRPRLSLSRDAASDLTAPAASAAVRAALAVPPAKRTAPQTAVLHKWYAPRDAGWQTLAKAEAEHLAKAPKPGGVKALVSSEGLPAIRLHTQGNDFLTDTHFVRRGDPAQKEGVAAVSFLQVLMPDAEAQGKWLAPPPAGSRTTFRRAALANWMTDADGGAGHLAARVIVNRLWQHHLGRGIVPTVSDFGLRGEPPTHPELLDFLAAELIRGGWRLKPIHKLIVTSAAYRRTSERRSAELGMRNETPTPQSAVLGFAASIPHSVPRTPHSADPDNKWLARYPVRRLEAEVIRDCQLFLAGMLDTTMYGPGTLDEASKRRSVYFTTKRSRLIPALAVFDAPDGTSGVGERASTTIAPQSLMLMNSPHVRAAAKAFGGRVLGDGAAPDADVIARACRMALARDPTPAELAAGVQFLAGATGPARAAALADFCQVLFCLNDFLYAG